MGAVAVMLVAAGCIANTGDETSGTTTTSTAPEAFCPEAPDPPPTSGLPPPPEETSPLFVPATSREGDRIVMPVTFLDGTTAELVYDAELALESALIVPYWYAEVDEHDGSYRDLIIRYGSLTDRPGFLNELVSTEAVHDDALVCVYHVDLFNDDYLMFEFEDWIVGIHSADDMTPEIRSAWIDGLELRTTPDGFPVVEGIGTIELAAQQLAGPELEFQKGGPGIEIGLNKCALDDNTFESGELNGYGRRCVPGTGVQISVSGYSGATVDEVLQGLEIRNLVPGR